MDKSTIVIGIDHGWANMKTVSHLLTSGVKEITTEPALYEEVLEWEGKFYKIGGKWLEVKKNMEITLVKRRLSLWGGGVAPGLSERCIAYMWRFQT